MTVTRNGARPTRSAVDEKESLAMEARTTMNRRSFLATGAAGTAGIIAGMQTPTAAPIPHNHVVTGVPGKKLVGYYSTMEEILGEPKYLDALQKQFGVNVLLCSPPIKMPQWMRDLNPIGPNRTLVARAHTDDDTDVFRAVEETHRRGMDFWLYYTGHHYGAESRPIMSETFDGIKFLDLPSVKYSLENMRTSCFTKPVVKEYEPACFAYGAATYGADSMYVSHYRYANPSYWMNLFGCACPYCQDEAVAMGYDFGKMKRAMTSLLKSLKKLDKGTVEKVAEVRLTFTDFLVMLGDDDGVLDWIKFRAKVVGNQLKRINGAVRTATSGRCGFITDTHNPTLAILVGHDYADFFDGASDAFHTLSWCSTQHVSVVAAWANQLCEWVPGLDGKTAVRAVSKLFGWDEIGLPEDNPWSVIGLNNPDDKFSIPQFYEMFNPDRTISLMTHEWTRLAAINNGRLPAHPVIKADVWPEKVCRELMDRAVDLGLTGYVLQRTNNLIDKSKL